jgi:hypothetical protein
MCAHSNTRLKLKYLAYFLVQGVFRALGIDVTLVYIQVRCRQSKGLEGKVSCYTVRPSTLRLTLFYIMFANRMYLILIRLYFNFQPLTKLLVVEQQPELDKAIG